MSGFVFTLKRTPAQTVDLSPLTPERLAGNSVDEIARVTLTSGNRKLAVAELFDIDSNEAPDITIRASTERLAYVGARMASGAITVEGDCGLNTGLGLKGGTVTVHGNTGAFAGSGMRAGVLDIRGNAGDFVGAALAGDKHGMAGGVIAIGGDAGDRVGDRLRRGMILVKGNVGAYCGSRMLAGTILVCGKVGGAPGFGLKRGTLILRHDLVCVPATFQDAGTHSLVFLKLLERYFERSGPPFRSFAPLTARAHRYSGDLASGGKGEILVLADTHL